MSNLVNFNASGDSRIQFSSEGSRVIIQQVPYVGIIREGLILNWDVSNPSSYPGTGTSITDLSGNGNSGSLEGGTTYSTQNGGCFVFDGINDHILFSKAHAAGINELTIEMYVAPDIVSNTMTMYDEGGNTWFQYVLRQDAWYTRDTSTGTQGARNNDIFPSSGNPFSAGVWKYVSLVYSVAGGFKRYYINGSLLDSSTTSVDTTTTGERVPNVSKFGLPTDGTYFDGKLGSMAIYNRALTDAEVLANFNITKTRFGL